MSPLSPVSRVVFPRECGAVAAAAVDTAVAVDADPDALVTLSRASEPQDVSPAVSDGLTDENGRRLDLHLLVDCEKHARSGWEHEKVEQEVILQVQHGRLHVQAAEEQREQTGHGCLVHEEAVFVVRVHRHEALVGMQQALRNAHQEQPRRLLRVLHGQLAEDARNTRVVRAGADEAEGDDYQLRDVEPSPSGPFASVDFVVLGAVIVCSFALFVLCRANAVDVRLSPSFLLLVDNVVEEDAYETAEGSVGSAE